MVSHGLQAVILGFVSAVVATLQTWSVSRFGPIYGGVLGTVPILIIPASIVLSFEVDPWDFEEILYCVPLGVYVDCLSEIAFFSTFVLFSMLTSQLDCFILNCTISCSLLNIFLLLALRNIPLKFIWKIRRQTIRMVVLTAISLLVWAILAIILRFVIVALEKKRVHIIYPALAAFILQVLVAMVVIVCGSRFHSKGEGKVAWKLYILTAVLGLVTGIGIVFLSKVDDSSEGLLMSFPVVLLASVSSLSSTYRETLPLCTTTAMIGGSVSTSLYAIIFAESLPMFDKIMNKDRNNPVQPSPSPNNGTVPAAQITFKPASVAVATIVCWLICLLCISLPVLFLLRCLARREKDHIDKVTFIDPNNMNTIATWERFGDDDNEFEDEGYYSSNVPTGLLESTESLSSSPYNSNGSSYFASEDMGNAALRHRRQLLEESTAEEVPLLMSGMITPPMPSNSSPERKIAKVLANSRS